MISLKNFNLSRLLSQQVAPVCLGRELQGSNVFLDFFGCVSTQIAGGLSALLPALYVFSRALATFFSDLFSARSAAHSSPLQDGFAVANLAHHPRKRVIFLNER
jgi:hypothetical protein